MAALEAVKRLGNDMAGICSLPATLNRVPRQSALVRQIPRILIVDGCHNGCAKRLLESVGIKPDAYVNLELDMGLRKAGPFTGSDFDRETVNLVADVIVATCQTLVSDSTQNVSKKPGR